MKKTKLFGLAIVATLMGASFSACTNEADEVLAQESEIKLTSQLESNSRTTNTQLQSTSIVANRSVGISIANAKNPHNNIAWKVNADGSLTNIGEKVYWGNGNASIYAYHPYNEDWTGTDHIFTVQTNQSTDEGYLNSDLLYGWKGNVSHTSSPIAIPFLHHLSKINITLTSNEDLNGAKIYICNTYNSLTINPKSNSNWANISVKTDGNKNDIYAGQITEAPYAVSAIIIPQRVIADTKFIKINFDGKDYFYVLPTDQCFEQGEFYNYTLNLTKKQELVEISSIKLDVIEWGDNDNNDFTGNAGEGDGITDIYQGEAGTFSTIVGDYGTFSHLKLSGNINTTDLAYIKENLRGLQYLDISDATLKNVTDVYMSLFGNIRHLSLPKNIEALGDDLAPSSLETIVIPANVTIIASQFSTSLKEIHCKATNPPTLTSPIWTDGEHDFSHLKVYVPEGSQSSYSAANIWKNFEVIEE